MLALGFDVQAFGVRTGAGLKASSGELRALGF